MHPGKSIFTFLVFSIKFAKELLRINWCIIYLYLSFNKLRKQAVEGCDGLFPQAAAGCCGLCPQAAAGGDGLCPQAAAGGDGLLYVQVLNTSTIKEVLHNWIYLLYIIFTSIL